MSVARSIGGRGEPEKSVKVSRTEGLNEEDERISSGEQEVNLLPQSVAYEMAVFLAS